MTYKLKKKLLHFETNGSSIAEDFIAARRGKVRALRKRLRICFYVHSAAVLLCIAAAVVLGTVSDIVKISVCVAASLAFAVFAAGDHTYAKRLACVIDAVIAAASILLAVFDKNKLLYILCAVFTFMGLISLILMTFYGSCKRFLEDYSPLSIRRDDYTLLNEVGYKLYTGANSSVRTSSVTANVNDASEPVPPLPPLTSEMRELARQVCRILLTNVEKKPEKRDKNDSFFTTNSQ